VGTSKTTLMLFTIGPVQEFIAQARKTRDLWFGSHLLSELSKTAAIRLSDCGAHLIFPYLSNQNNEQLKQLKVPNKILGLIETDHPKQIALEVREAVVERWKSYANQAQDLMDKTVNPAMWKRQVNDFIEFYAVWSQLTHEKDYMKVLQQTEKLMAARKTLRDFRQNDPSHVFGDKKSSLDGGRESVLVPSRMSELARFGIKENETLDAISVVKRLSKFIEPESAKTFPSVCDIAFLHFRNELKTHKKAGKLVSDYYRKIVSEYGDRLRFEGTEIKDYDSRLFYPGRIEDFVDEQAKLPLSKEEKKQITQQISESLQALYELTNQQPTPYYAFLLCDGDRMGSVLRTLKTYKEHQLFSQHLSRFASEAERIVSEHEGRLIYSGGDDVMAYLPLHLCLEASNALRLSFSGIMKEAISDPSSLPTLSVGIAIVHMREPLEEVRKLALEAERMAKKQRNELAVILQKRSGSDPLKISLSFAYDPVATIRSFQEMFRKNIYSAKFAYELRLLYDEYKQMQPHGLWLQNEVRLRKLLKQEIERLVWKKKPEGVSNECIEAKFLPLLNQTFDRVYNGGALESLERLAEQMILAVQLQKAGNFDDADASNTAS